MNQLSVSADDFENLGDEEEISKHQVLPTLTTMTATIDMIIARTKKFEPTREKLDHTTTLLEKKISEYRAMLQKVRANHLQVTKQSKSSYSKSKNKRPVDYSPGMN
mmetsp:Transcript_41353/g.63010  ORF Transcript_41353/g.63010 Transcript_41353/m.63010 type:complete len:106 (+) Transcript_41353:2299-2616(+)